MSERESELYKNELLRKKMYPSRMNVMKNGVKSCLEFVMIPTFNQRKRFPLITKSKNPWNFNGWESPIPTFNKRTALDIHMKSVAVSHSLDEKIDFLFLKIIS